MKYINKNKSNIRAAIFSRARDKDNGLPKLTNLNTGGVVRGILELFSWATNNIYEFLDGLLDQAFPVTATGKWLEWHTKRISITRHTALSAVGIIAFSRTGTSGNLKIPEGTIVKTALDSFGNEYRYISTADTILQDGQSSVNVSVAAEMSGVNYNAGTGLITILVSSVPGIESVSNAAGWLSTEAAAEESDEALYNRYVLRWEELNGMTSGAYKSWAYSVEGVKEAWVNEDWPRGRGTVDLYITGSAGLPTSGLLGAVDAVVQGKNPATDDAAVYAPSGTEVSIDVSVEAVPDYTDTAWLSARGTEILNALFYSGTVEGVSPFKIEEDVLKSRIQYELMKITDDSGASPVRKVTINSPAADVAVSAGSLAVLSGAVAVAVTVATEI